MIKDYKELLPSYLDGSNITAHADIMNSENSHLQNLYSLIGYIFEVGRPILIEKVQTSAYETEILIHVHTHEAIANINISGDYEYTKEYEEITGEDIISFTVSDSQHTLVNPNITVTVETVEGNLYQKGYPENDSIQKDVYDHDEFLDQLGALLNLPRRLYSSYQLINAENTTPPYFGKEVIEGVVQETTEDDYYYSQRILLFLQGGVFNIIKASTVDTITLIQNNMIPVGDTTTFLINAKNFENLEYSEWKTAIQQYLPCTREIQLLEPASPVITLTVNPNFLNCFDLHGDVTWNNYPLANYGLQLTDARGRLITSFTTNSNGHIGEHVAGLAHGVTPLRIVGEEAERGITGVTYTVGAGFPETLYMDKNVWSNRNNLQNTTNRSLLVPAGVTTTTPLSLGVFYPFPDTWELFFVFYFNTGNAKLGIRQGGGHLFSCNPASCYVGSESVHNLRLKTLNGVIYMYLDGLYTGQHFNQSNLIRAVIEVVLTGGVTVSSIRFKSSTDIINPPTEQETITPVGTVTCTNTAYNQRILHIPLEMTFQNTKFQLTINGGGEISAVSDTNNVIDVDVGGSRVEDISGVLTLRNMVNPSKTLIVDNPFSSETEREFAFNNNTVTLLQGDSFIIGGSGDDYKISLPGRVMVGISDLFDTRYTQNTLFKISEGGAGQVVFSYLTSEKEELSAAELEQLNNNINLSGLTQYDDIYFMEYRSNGTIKICKVGSSDRNYTLDSDAKRGFLIFDTTTSNMPAVLKSFEITNYNVNLGSLDGTTYTHVLSRSQNNMTIPLRNTDLDRVITTGTMEISLMRGSAAPLTLYDGSVLSSVDFSTLMELGIGTYPISILWRPIDDDKGIYLRELGVEFSLKVIEGLHLTGIHDTYRDYYEETITVTGVLSNESGTMSGKSVRLMNSTGTETILTTTTGSDGSFTFNIHPTSGWYDKQYKVVATGDYETISETFTLELVRHNVTLTMPPSITGNVGDTVELPITLNDENDNVVTCGEVTATLKLLPDGAMLGLDPEVFLLFTDCEVYTENDTRYAFCTMRMVDEEGTTVEGSVNNTNPLQIRIGEEQVTITLPNNSFDVIGRSGGMFEFITPLSSVTINGTNIEWSSNITTNGTSIGSYTFKQEYTEEE